MEIPNCKGTSTRSCNSVMTSFTTLQLSRQSFALACLPSRANGLLLLWPTTSFAEAAESARCCRGTAGLLPWLLDTQGHTTNFARSPVAHRFFHGFPAIVFCLPQSGSAFLMCRRAGRNCCPCKLRASRRTSRRPQGFSGLGKLSTESTFTMTWAQLSK